MTNQAIWSFLKNKYRGNIPRKQDTALKVYEVLLTNLPRFFQLTVNRKYGCGLLRKSSPCPGFRPLPRCAKKNSRKWLRLCSANPSPCAGVSLRFPRCAKKQPKIRLRLCFANHSPCAGVRFASPDALKNSRKSGCGFASLILLHAPGFRSASPDALKNSRKYGCFLANKHL